MKDMRSSNTRREYIRIARQVSGDRQVIAGSQAPIQKLVNGKCSKEAGGR